MIGMKYKKKYIWGPILLEEVLRKEAIKAKKVTNLPISASDMGFKLANDLKEGRIKLAIPNIVNENNQLFMNIGNKNVKKKKQKR